MNLAVSGMMEACAKVQYLGRLVHIDALRQVDLLSTDVESANPLTVKNLLRG